MTILGYTVMSNHIHLLVIAEGKSQVIPDTLALAEARIAQEFNQRKSRVGAFWGDRYQATAVESGGHFLKCLLYIDLNAVRAGIVEHPRQWRFCGYNEIMRQKQRYTLVNMVRLLELVEIRSREEFWRFYTGLIDRSIADGDLRREKKWSESIAVGSEKFVEGLHARLGIESNRIKIVQSDQDYLLREKKISYV
jgi:hypothetical protein